MTRGKPTLILASIHFGRIRSRDSRLARNIILGLDNEEEAIVPGILKQSANRSFDTFHSEAKSRTRVSSSQQQCSSFRPKKYMVRM
jgi:hypothetical protein